MEARLSERWGWRLIAAAGLAVVAMGFVIACGNGEDEREGSIEISNARARFTTTDIGAVYFDIRSVGADDALVAASADIADDVQIHEVVTEGGRAMMRPVEGGIAVAADGRVVLEPGGYHVMLLGVSEVPEPGATFSLVLEFENAGRMTITVPVHEFGGEDDGMGQGSMGGDGIDHDHEQGRRSGPRVDSPHFTQRGSSPCRSAPSSRRRRSARPRP